MWRISRTSLSSLQLWSRPRSWPHNLPLSIDHFPSPLNPRLVSTKKKPFDLYSSLQVTPSASLTSKTVSLILFLRSLSATAVAPSGNSCAKAPESEMQAISPVSAVPNFFKRHLHMINGNGTREQMWVSGLLQRARVAQAIAWRLTVMIRRGLPSSVTVSRRQD